MTVVVNRDLPGSYSKSNSNVVSRDSNNSNGSSAVHPAPLSPVTAAINENFDSSNSSNAASDQVATSKQQREFTHNSPEDTAIIFDWDDTLLASSWLASKNLRLDFPIQVPQEAVSQLQVLEESVIKLINRALELGVVHLITNAEHGWVELSCKKFMPNVLPLLYKCRIISARTSFERRFPEQPNKWKVEAFRHQISDTFRHIFSSDELRASKKLNILSFGDSIHEREALHIVTGTIENTLSKSIKFVERPTMEQLRRQIELVSNCFEYICTYGGNLDLMLTIQLLYTE